MRGEKRRGEDRRGEKRTKEEKRGEKRRGEEKRGEEKRWEERRDEMRTISKQCSTHKHTQTHSRTLAHRKPKRISRRNPWRTLSWDTLWQQGQRKEPQPISHTQRHDITSFDNGKVRFSVYRTKQATMLWSVLWFNEWTYVRTPCIANTAAMSFPLLAAEDDSDVTVAAKGYSPPTPAPVHARMGMIRREDRRNSLRN